ncbi:MAP kinase phosphatase 6 [Micractinium conductrix]|uniref:MAP kinase phosphatase 6 n=1 Tax=Micractinium conductrix TaxID=554055 RepID=A0A2P6VRN7_9CHLO|nr:MAP kinase phosphatase 6 [Micractinium conductrix]|eukprot:PSC76737.1 MAP kinase phosphatase 6 [Micractinium conductrix]
MVQYASGGEPCTAPAHDYGLPPLPPLPCSESRGPTPWSNWVLRGRLLAGAYPASLDDEETERILTTLLELGVNTFVCLQAEFSLHTPESAWRSGQGLRPYIKDAQRLLIAARESGSRRILQEKLDFLHLPIIDGSVTSDAALSRLADDCCTRILRGERLYVHCWGGHGRTGTLIAVMLGRMYGLTCAAALRYTQAFHDSRKYPQGVRSPQTTPQVAQVKRLLPDPPSMRGVVYPRDSSVILDDVILRPSSAASAKPAAAAPAPTAPVPVPPSRGSAGGAAAAAAALSDGVAVLQLDDVPAMSHVPVNQQRKEAIRAAKASGSPPASPPSAAATALSTALHGAGLQPHTAAAAAAAAIPASRPPADRQRDWLASVFGKAAAQPGVGADAARRVPTSVPQQSPGQHAGYLKAWQQQHSHLHQQQQEQQAGAGKLSAGTPVFLTATAGSAAGAPAPLYGAGADLHAASEPVDLRPSLLHVGVPVGGSGTAPERSASSVQRMRNYFSGATPK